jgi:pimeloyl-ACP methyl ester carboxylesterase
VTLTHRIDGDDSHPPLLLLNGGLMSIGAWQPFVEPLATRYRVIRCDFRGQLLTPGPFPTSIGEHASDVIALLDELQIERAQLAGVSFGGLVAMQVAASYPERVERLTVISATDYTTASMRHDAVEGRELAENAANGGDGGEVFRRVAATTWTDAWLAKQPPDFIESRARAVASLPTPFFAGAAALIGLLETLDLRPFLPKITAPALVIGAAEDRVFPPEHARAIAAAIPHARLEIVPNTGHGLLFEQAEQVIGWLLAGPD